MRQMRHMTKPTVKSDDEQLADKIRATYRRYVTFRERYEAAEAGTLPLWTMHAYVFGDADATPNPLVTAPTSGAGKSTIIGVAKCLVHEPYTAIAATPAALFHAIDTLQPTLLLDEADQLRENRHLRAVFNAGFEPGTPVRRVPTKANPDGTYDVYCPKMFSGIAHEDPPLTQATLSRCIRIPMQREKHAGRFRYRTVYRDCENLRSQLFTWGREHSEQLGDAGPDMPAGLTDRQEDCWRPLIAIADLIGGPWPEDVREWALELTRAIDSDPDPNVQILTDVKRVLDRFPGQRIATRELARLRNELPGRDYEDEVSPGSLGKRLAALGIRPHPSAWREGGAAGRSERGFIVRSGGAYTRPWADAFKRHAISPLTVASVASVARRGRPQPLAQGWWLGACRSSGESGLWHTKMSGLRLSGVPVTQNWFCGRISSAQYRQVLMWFSLYCGPAWASGPTHPGRPRTPPASVSLPCQPRAQDVRAQFPQERLTVDAEGFQPGEHRLAAGDHASDERPAIGVVVAHHQLAAGRVAVEG